MIRYRTDIVEMARSGAAAEHWMWLHPLHGGSGVLHSKTPLSLPIMDGTAHVQVTGHHGRGHIRS